MEPSIKEQKIQAMKNYKRATFVYNLVLYSLTSIITCFFFSYSFWFPSLDHFLSSIPNSVSFFLNAKCFFIVGNLIVLILVGESKLRQSSSSSSSPDMYDEYVSRSRRGHHNVESKEMHGCMKSLNVEEVTVCKTSNMAHEEKKKAMRKSKSEVWGESGIVKVKGKKEEVHKSSGEEKKIGMRSSKSEIWGESGIIIKVKGKKEENHKNSGEEKKIGMRSSKSEIWGKSGLIKVKGKKEEVHKSSCEEKNIGMRSSKSEIWSVSENVKREKTKGKREEEINKSSVNYEEKRIGMRSSKSEVWGESEIMKSKGVKEESFNDEEMRRGCKSEIWGESEIMKSKGVKEESNNNMCNDEEKSRGMRSCKSAIWGESGIIKSKGEKEEFCKNSNMGYDEEKKMGMRNCKSAIWGENEIVKDTRGKEEDLNKRVEAFIARVNNQRLLEAKFS